MSLLKRQHRRTKDVLARDKSNFNSQIDSGRDASLCKAHCLVPSRIAEHGQIRTWRKPTAPPFNCGRCGLSCCTRCQPAFTSSSHGFGPAVPRSWKTKSSAAIHELIEDIILLLKAPVSTNTDIDIYICDILHDYIYIYVREAPLGYI